MLKHINPWLNEVGSIGFMCLAFGGLAMQAGIILPDDCHENMRACNEGGWLQKSDFSGER